MGRCKEGEAVQGRGEREFEKRSIKLNRFIWYVKLHGSIFK